MKTRWLWHVLGLLVVLVLAWGAWGVAPAHAADPTPTPVITDDQVNAVAHTLYCPVCENTPLDVCGTQACAQWRELIRQQLQQGWTVEQIQQYFVDNYGARVLAAPPREGFWWLAYVVPPAVILAGLYILYRTMKQWYRPRQATAGEGEAADAAAASPSENAASSADDDYLRRLEEELRRRT
ncbi:MAG: hypothetical protein GXO56_05485 [Chloroflexi bacterium]|nr:hypothetical protein [Chloroflexota bacterium]